MSGKRQYPSIHVIGIAGVPEIGMGDRLGDILSKAAQKQATPLQENDVLVVTQKVISKSEGQVVSLKSVTPSKYARQIAADSGKNPCLVELILRESRSIIRMDSKRGVIITETNHGFICANAGIDSSNIGDDDRVSLLPKNPDMSAKRLMNYFKKTLDLMIALTQVKLSVYPESRGNVSNLVFTLNGDLDLGSSPG